MEEAEGDCEAQEQAASHTHWEEEGELTSVEPTAQENKHIKRRTYVITRCPF